jgi:hypothetical protein
MIRVNFPDDVAAGDTISGSVYSEPAGRDQKEVESNSGELTGFVVEMPGQKARTAETRFQWNVPPAVRGGVTILLRDRRNRVVAQCPLPVAASAPPAVEGGIELPLGGQAGSLVSAWGKFSDPERTSVTVGGKAVNPIAQSPRKLVFQAPLDAVGATRIEVRSGGVSAAGIFYSLGLRLSATKRNLLSGETAEMTAIVTGLQDLKEAAWIVLVNHDPTTIGIAGGPVQRVAIRPSEVLPDGTYRLVRTLTGVRGGGFDITVTVTRPPAEQIPVDRLVDRTVESWSRSNQIAISTEARSLIVAGVDAARSRLDEFFLSQIAFRPEPAGLLDRLVRSYCFDLRDLKLGEGRAGIPARAPLHLANAFAPQPASVPAVTTLDASDVKRFSFVQFLSQLFARWTPSQPFGTLVVTSQPDRQTITVDQGSGPNFFTARSFVVSVGNHNVKVASCNRSVLVTANQQTLVSCP